MISSIGKDDANDPSTTVPMAMCPFCEDGGIPKVVSNESPMYYAVACVRCGAEGPVVDQNYFMTQITNRVEIGDWDADSLSVACKMAAVKLWNKRHHIH